MGTPSSADCTPSYLSPADHQSGMRTLESTRRGEHMETRALGSLRVSVVGLGCNNFGTRLDQAGTTNVVHGALDAGVTFFDTADIYGATQSEVMLGVALGARRGD